MTRDTHPLALRLRSFPLFSDCAVEPLDALSRGSRLRILPEGQLVLREMDQATHVFALLSGAVRVFYTSPEGSRLVAKLFVAPAVFGEMENLVDIRHLESVEVMSTAELACFPRASFVTCLRQSPEVMYRMLVDLSARFCIAAQHERALAFQRVPARVASLLLSYGRLFGVPGPSGLRIKRRLTQDELAEGLGVTRKSVQRAIEDFRRRRLLLFRSSQWVLIDCHALAIEAGAESASLDYSLARERLVRDTWAVLDAPQPSSAPMDGA